MEIQKRGLVDPKGIVTTERSGFFLIHQQTNPIHHSSIVMSKMFALTSPQLRHFDRSVAKWRNLRLTELPPLWGAPFIRRLYRRMNRGPRRTCSLGWLRGMFAFTARTALLHTTTTSSFRPKAKPKWRNLQFSKPPRRLAIASTTNFDDTPEQISRSQ